MNILSLFSGTQSWTKYYNSEDTVLSVDIAFLYPNTLCRDILTWNYKTEISEYLDSMPDVVYASPPCNLYFTNMRQLNSICTYTDWEKQLSLDLVNKTIEIISWCRPKYYIIENPVGKMKQHYPKLFNKEPLTVDYCQYGMGWKKPTNLWTNVELMPKRCNHHKVKHAATIRHAKNGYVTNEQYRAMIPPLLSLEITNLIKSKPL